MTNGDDDNGDDDGDVNDDDIFITVSNRIHKYPRIKTELNFTSVFKYVFWLFYIPIQECVLLMLQKMFRVKSERIFVACKMYPSVFCAQNIEINIHKVSIYCDTI